MQSQVYDQPARKAFKGTDDRVDRLAQRAARQGRNQRLQTIRLRESEQPDFGESDFNDSQFDDE